MKITELKPGDIPAISIPRKFLPRAIRVFMWLWMLIRYRKSYRGRLYNHSMIIVGHRGDNNAEAISKGFVVRNFEKHYKDKLGQMVVFRLKEPLCTYEVMMMQNKTHSLANRNVEYEKLNFLWWIVYILSNGKWDLSPKGEKQDDKVFCFEASCMVLNAARSVFANPSHINTADLMNDDRFEMLYFD